MTTLLGDLWSEITLKHEPRDYLKVEPTTRVAVKQLSIHLVLNIRHDYLTLITCRTGGTSRVSYEDTLHYLHLGIPENTWNNLKGSEIGVWECYIISWCDTVKPEIRMLKCFHLSQYQ